MSDQARVKHTTVTMGPKREDVTGVCRKRYNYNLHNLYSSSNFIQVTKSWMRWQNMYHKVGI
jgi:hypothetical protein